MNEIPKSASIPEPPPSTGIASVPDSLIGWLFRSDIDDELTNKNRDGRWGMAIELVNERDAFGRAKYKGPLMTHNGRNMIEDARQELGDAMQYIHGAKMEGLDLSAIRPLIEVLRLMVGD